MFFKFNSLMFSCCFFTALMFTVSLLCFVCVLEAYYLPYCSIVDHTLYVYFVSGPTIWLSHCHCLQVYIDGMCWLYIVHLVSQILLYLNQDWVPKLISIQLGYIKSVFGSRRGGSMEHTDADGWHGSSITAMERCQLLSLPGIRGLPPGQMNL